MQYYYDHKKKGQTRSTINMELSNGNVVRLHTKDPKKNKEFVEEITRLLRQLEKLDLQNYIDIERMHSTKLTSDAPKENARTSLIDGLFDEDKTDPLNMDANQHGEGVTHNIYEYFSFEMEADAEE